MIAAATLPDRRQLLHARDLLRELVSRELKLRYKRSVLGLMWSLVTPLLQVLAFNFVFRSVLPLNVPHYPAFVLTGVLAWTWFQSSLVLASGAIVDNRELIRRPGFPSAALPAVTVATHLVHFLLALPVLLVFVAFDGGRFSADLLALPLVVAIQYVLTLSLAYPIATCHVRFRDTQHLVGVLLTVLFFFTPVFYEARSVPVQFRGLYDLNPMVQILSAYRGVLIQDQPVDLGSLGVLGVVALLMLTLGFEVFRRASFRFVEEL
jgi:lipopolysaccharide transport system permease protein